MNGGPGCVPPILTTNPVASMNYSACTGANNVVLNAGMAGSQPINIHWYKDEAPLSDGVTAGGSTIVGATTMQLRVQPPLSGFDAGSYVAQGTGACGTTVYSSETLVQYDPAFPLAPNDTCATPQVVTAGTNVLAPAQSPCSAYFNDPASGASCVTSRADRWYVFSPATTGNYRIETCGSNFDTVLSVFDECGGI